MKLEINVLGDRAVRDDLVHLGIKAGYPAPVFEVVGRMLEAGIRRQFATQGGEFGEGWPAVSGATVPRKGSSQTLVDTGAMLGSLYHKATKTQVKAGLKDYKARFHQGGTTRGLPARPGVGRSGAVERQAIAVVREYLLGDL